MVAMSTTKLTSKGQIVIPEAIRERMGLRAGNQFVVFNSGDSVILKRLSPPTDEELSQLLADARAAAKKAGIKPADIRRAIRRVRGQA